MEYYNDYEEEYGYVEEESREWELADEMYENLRMNQIEETNIFFKKLYNIDTPNKRITYRTSYKTSTSLIIELKVKPGNTIITLDIPRDLYEKVDRIVRKYINTPDDRLDYETALKELEDQE